MTITVANPWTKGIVHLDMSDLTEAQLDAYAVLMDDELIEEINSNLAAPSSPAEFLAAWAERVGPDEAGRVILGS